MWYAVSGDRTVKLKPHPCDRGVRGRIAVTVDYTAPTDDATSQAPARTWSATATLSLASAGRSLTNNTATWIKLKNHGQTEEESQEQADRSDELQTPMTLRGSAGTRAASSCASWTGPRPPAPTPTGIHRPVEGVAVDDWADQDEVSRRADVTKHIAHRRRPDRRHGVCRAGSSPPRTPPSSDPSVEVAATPT